MKDFRATIYFQRNTHMAKRWLIAVLIAGLFGGKAFADCAPSPDTPASVIEYFQRFNKPLPEQFCANQDAGPQASVEPPQEARQTEESEPESAENPRVSADLAHGEQAKTALEQSKPQPIAPQATQSPHAITPDEAPPKIAANPTVPTPQMEATQTPKPQPESSQDLARQQEFGQEPGKSLGSRQKRSYAMVHQLRPKSSDMPMRALYSESNHAKQDGYNLSILRRKKPAGFRWHTCGQPMPVLIFHRLNAPDLSSRQGSLSSSRQNNPAQK